jgi:hypothetical protein
LLAVDAPAANRIVELRSTPAASAAGSIADGSKPVTWAEGAAFYANTLSAAEVRWNWSWSGSDATCELIEVLYVEPSVSPTFDRDDRL